MMMRLICFNSLILKQCIDNIQNIVKCIWTAAMYWCFITKCTFSTKTKLVLAWGFLSKLFSLFNSTCYEFLTNTYLWILHVKLMFSTVLLFCNVYKILFSVMSRFQRKYIVLYGRLQKNNVVLFLVVSVK